MGLFNWLKILPSGQRGNPSVPRSSGIDTDNQRGVGQAMADVGTDAAKRGVTLLAAGDLYGAREAFSEAARLSPRSAANQVNLAYALQQTGAEAEALTHLQLAVSIDAQSFDAHYMLAGVLERLPDLQGAIANLQQALALRPSFNQHKQIYVEC